MNELDDYEQIISTALDKLQTELDALTKKDFTQKVNIIKKCTTQIKNISILIDSYDLDICNVDSAYSHKYNDSLIAINKRFSRMKAELDVKKKYGTDNLSLFKDRLMVEAPTEAQQMIDLGDQTQKKAISVLDGIIKTVHASNQLADDINVELDNQIQQLDRMHDTIKDTQTTLKRTGRYLKYFARQIYTDKLLMCLIGLIFVAVIGLIVMQAMGFDKIKSTSSSDTIIKTNSSINVTIKANSTATS